MWPRKMRACRPVAVSQSRTVPSRLDVARRSPEGLNARPVMASSCPRNERTSAASVRVPDRDEPRLAECAAGRRHHGGRRS